MTTEPIPVVEGREKALAVRYALNLAAAPIADIFSFIERMYPDTLVIRKKMEPGPAGALVRSGKDWLVIVNTHEAILSRQRFTAAHELGHRIFDAERFSVYVDDNLKSKDPAETRANAFAVNLLLPGQVLLDRHRSGEFDVGNDDHIALLAVEYGISVQSLSYHLKSNGLVTERRRQEIEQIKPNALALKLGFVSSARAEVEAMNVTGWPTRFIRLAAAAFARQDVTEQQLLEFLGEGWAATEIRLSSTSARN